MGLNGGKDGLGPEITVAFPDGTVEHALKMRARALPAGTVVECKTGGGGGNGDPMERDFDAVARDVARGLVSPTAAQRDYGVVIAEDGSVDTEASVPR